MLFRLVLALTFLGFAATANAGAKEDLHATFSKFLAQTAFKGTTTATLGGRTIHSVVEFQAPDRYRISSEGRPPSVIIGGSMYVNINGRFMKMPMPMSLAQYRDPNIVAQIESSLSVEDLGMDSVGGAPAHKYRYQLAGAHPSKVTIWVSVASGLPIQLQNAGQAMGKTLDTTINYSNYSDPTIKISAPN
jgi:outer membrane lipoprotein-sorting protein